ncbi:MAG: HPr kinase/phosphorylase [Paracoccaceae bacterium]
MTEAATHLHGSAIAVGSQGLLIIGAPGTGKSTLALDMIARGAQLVSDDQVAVQAEGARLMLSAPDPIAGLIEARGVGILKMPYLPAARLHLMVDLDRETPGRLPERKDHCLLGHQVPVILGAGLKVLAPILILLLTEAKLMDPDHPETA